MHDGCPTMSLLLRLPPSLRERATELAHEEGVSLNFFITRALTESLERCEARMLVRDAERHNLDPSRRST